MGLSLSALYKKNGKIESYPLGKYTTLIWRLCAISGKPGKQGEGKTITQRGIHPDFKESMWIKDDNYFGFNWCAFKEFKEVFKDLVGDEINFSVNDDDPIQFCVDC